MPKTKTATPEVPVEEKILTAVQTVSYGGQNLTILNHSGEYVPQSAIKINYPSQTEAALALGVRENMACLVMGETGTGKTSAARYIAWLRKQSYTRINMHGYNTPDELIGSKSVKDGSTYYEDGILVKAMKEGHLCVLDEINATPPDCLFIIHGLLDDDHRVSLPNGDIITPHPDFRFFATMNPDYEGTKSLNRAFLDRFNIIVQVKTLEPEQEESLLVERTGVDVTLAKAMVTVAFTARKAYTEQKTLTYVSTRSLLQWSELVKNGIESSAAYELCVVNKARIEEQLAFKDFYSAVFKTKPSDANFDPITLVRNSEVNKMRLAVNAAQGEASVAKQNNDAMTKTIDTLVKKLRQYVPEDEIKRVTNDVQTSREQRALSALARIQGQGHIRPEDMEELRNLFPPEDYNKLVTEFKKRPGAPQWILDLQTA